MMLRMIDAWCRLPRRVRCVIAGGLFIAGLALTGYLDATTPGAMYY